jgi:hypothetical protein
MMMRRKNERSFQDSRKFPASWTRSSEPGQGQQIYVNKR